MLYPTLVNVVEMLKNYINRDQYTTLNKIQDNGNSIDAMMSIAFEEIMGQSQFVSTRSKHASSDGLRISLCTLLFLHRDAWPFNSSVLVFMTRGLFDPSCLVIFTFPIFLFTSNARANSTIAATTKKSETKRNTPSLSMLEPVGESF